MVSREATRPRTPQHGHLKGCKPFCLLRFEDSHVLANTTGLEPRTGVEDHVPLFKSHPPWRIPWQREAMSTNHPSRAVIRAGDAEEHEARQTRRKAHGSPGFKCVRGRHGASNFDTCRPLRFTLKGCLRNGPSPNLLTCTTHCSTLSCVSHVTWPPPWFESNLAMDFVRSKELSQNPIDRTTFREPDRSQSNLWKAFG